MSATKSRLRVRVVLGFFALLSIQVIGAAAGQPVKVQAAQRAFNDAYRQEDWSRAIDSGLDLVQMLPDSVLVKYNLACAYALAGDADSAFHWLARAAADGYSDLSHLDADTDFHSVRDRPGFSSVREEVAANERRRRRDIVERAAASSVLVVVPENYDRTRPAPLVIAFHGYGDRPEGYPRVWGEPAAEFDAILAVPQGQRPVGSGFGWGSVDEADAILQHTLNEVEQRFSVDPERVVLTGFSQGGFIALALGIRHRDDFVGVIPMAGPYVSAVDAPPPAREGDPRYYFIVGSRDRTVSDMRRAARDYESAGFDVKLRVVPSTGHSFPEDSHRELTNALRWILDR